MQSIEFLGGKYQQSEQVWPGPVQTFRARESTTGQSVFVHRVSTTDEAGQQISLLLLLSSALLRSAEARKLVREVSADAGFWYVVTESEQQCLLLREWLQFQSGLAVAQPEARVAVSQKADATIAAEPAKPSATEVPKSEPSQGPGEFTQFFKAGLPQPLKAAAREAPRAQDRPSNPQIPVPKDRPTRISGSVQRPNTPIPPLPQRPAEPRELGEFTKIFSGSASQGPGSRSADLLAGDARHANLPDAGGAKPSVPDMFSTGQGIPNATPSPAKEPGEYTRIFGKGAAPPPVQQSSVASPKAQSFDDPLAPPPAGAPPSSSSGKGPSEYTQVMKGISPQENPTGNAAKADGASSAAASPGVPLKIPVVPPIPKAPIPPKLPVPPRPQAPPQVAAALPALGAANPNKKLFVFLAILGVLAVLIILFFLAFNK